MVNRDAVDLLRTDLARLRIQIENLKAAYERQLEGQRLKIHELEAELAEARQYIEVLEYSINERDGARITATRRVTPDG